MLKIVKIVYVVQSTKKKKRHLLRKSQMYGKHYRFINSLTYQMQIHQVESKLKY